MNEKRVAQELIRLAKFIYAQDYTTLVGEKCDIAIKNKEMQRDELAGDIRDINKAWEKWDLRVLRKMGVIDSRLEKLTEQELDELETQGVSFR